MKFEPLGDQACLVRCQSESHAVQLASRLRQLAPGWLLDLVPAYSTVGVFFNADQKTVAEVINWLKQFDEMPAENVNGEANSRLHKIPVCYELGPDLPRVAELTKLTAEEVVRWHTGTVYTVYAIGFVPGFPYLGYLPEPLQGLSRLPSPRLRVEPGSVGLTGRQTGIYPLARPGGWNLIGKTPLQLVDVEQNDFPIRVGDQVEFQPIALEQYRQLEGQRLSAYGS